MSTPTVYAIFWLPSDHCLDGIWPFCHNERYENLIERYFKDVGNTPFYNILSEYSIYRGKIVRDGPIRNSSQFGGSYIDKTAYPLLIEDSDVRQAVARAINRNHWVPSLQTEFFVFTGLNALSCVDKTENLVACAPNVPPFFNNDTCAYHDYFLQRDQPVIYTNIPNPGTLFSIHGCAIPSKDSLNHDETADSAIALVSHEQFESVTDPEGNAWGDNSNLDEIADECQDSASPYGPVNLHSHLYIVQKEWSNSDGRCALSASSITDAARPEINTLTVSLVREDAQIIITGSGFGSNPPTTVIADGSVNTRDLVITDLSDGYWTAGNSGRPGVVLKKWDDSRVVIGLGTDYYTHGWVFQPGDRVQVQIRNPQSGMATTRVAIAVTANLLPDTSRQPVITGITTVLRNNDAYITIQGSGFGSNPAVVATPDNSEGVDSPSLYIIDESNGSWTAGHIDDYVGVDIQEWSDSKIVVSMGGDYNANGWVFNPGDLLHIRVTNPQTVLAATGTSVAQPA